MLEKPADGILHLQNLLSVTSSQVGTRLNLCGNPAASPLPVSSYRQRHTPMEEYLLSIFSVWQSSISRRHDSHDRYDGYFGIPPPLSSLTGEHPVNASAGVGVPRPPSARKPTPAVRKIKRFFRLRLQGVTHYTLPCKEPCARRSLWTPFWQGCALLYPPLCASDGRLAALPVSAVPA